MPSPDLGRAVSVLPLTASGRPRGGPQRIPHPVGVTLGEPPPWAHELAGQRQLGLDVVRQRLGARAPAAAPPDLAAGRRPSAVLVPLYVGRDGLRLLLTRRPWAMRAHSGEVSFPGGRADSTDRDLIHTALREAEEEIALPPSTVELIGVLDPLSTLTSGSLITPFVGVVHDRPKLRPNPAEVEAVLHVPLAELLSPAVYRHEWWPMPPHLRPLQGDDRRPMFFYDLAGDTVWGATARVLTQLLSVISGCNDPEAARPPG